MANILSLSQSSLLISSRPSPPRRVHLITNRHSASPATHSPVLFSSANRNPNSFTTIQARAASDSKVPTNFTVDSAGGGFDIMPDSGGSDDNFKGNSGGGGDGNGGGPSGGGQDEGGAHEKKPPGLSMSQKLTLGYAGLIVIGGMAGYVKAGSVKSLASGLVSAFVLGWVYNLLPQAPVQASILGLGVSALLLVVMGGRFWKSGKVFPAGVVAFTSLVMSGGYLHGILRSLH
ncbi:Protein FATTY ACID EXPORT 2- chloroplastic [Striga hermonthica]|uniref:Protein FATTY ACID EXPORT 2- chloroplastic n=1 Tax=Striga hermonthica TaxID=68872 RepID=A0A9N7NUX5_STRHE|nr:Protein FATTY ACID EXPORT 2- chloroplastic [Striga hermonthica]